MLVKPVLKNTNHSSYRAFNFIVVRVTGVEPARLAALDPKSSASANFATPAQKELYLFF